MYLLNSNYKLNGALLEYTYRKPILFLKNSNSVASKNARREWTCSGQKKGRLDDLLGLDSRVSSSAKAVISEIKSD